MTQQTLPGTSDGLEAERLKAWEAFFTPPSVVYQGLTFLRDTMRVRAPRYCLDPCAGAGVFGMVGKVVWPESRWHAVEPRLEEADHLRRWNDHVHLRTIQKALVTKALTRMTGAWDLVVGNPAFSLAHELVEQLVPELYARNGALALYLPTQWGQEQRQDAEKGPMRVMNLFPPAAMARIPGRIQHRSKGGTDRIMYSWFVWTRSVSPYWMGFQLPELPKADRRWTIRPGTETEEERDILVKRWRAWKPAPKRSRRKPLGIRGA